MPPPSASSATSGRGCPTAGCPRCSPPRPRCWRRCSAASPGLQVHRRQGPRRRAGMGQGAAPRPLHLPGGRRGHGPDPADPRRPVRGRVPALRAGQGAGRADRLRGHAGPHAGGVRDPRGRGRGVPWPVPLVLGRRVPGHQPAAAGAAGGLAGGAAGPGRGRRRGPDHLHLHRRHLRVPDRLRPPVPRGPGGPAGGQLPLQPGGPGPGQPAAGRHAGSRPSCGQAAGRDPALGPGADRCRLRERRAGGQGPGRRGRPAGPGRGRPDEVAVLVRTNAQIPRSRRRWPPPASATRSGASCSSAGPRCSGPSGCCAPARPGRPAAAWSTRWRRSGSSGSGSAATRSPTARSATPAWSPSSASPNAWRRPGPGS